MMEAYFVEIIVKLIFFLWWLSFEGILYPHPPFSFLDLLLEGNKVMNHIWPSLI